MRNVVFVIFLLPVVLSLLLGTLVLAEVVKDPDRQLNMMQFEISDRPIISSGAIKIIGLNSEYTTSQAVEVQISVSDATFDCGDLYVTIYDVSLPTRQPVTQSGYFGQCFAKNGVNLPISDKFSEKIDKAGQYELVVEMLDKNQQKTITVSKKFAVK
jgi:hypothetical protein